VQVEISEQLLGLVRDIAEAEGRSEAEVLEEAVLRYLEVVKERGKTVTGEGRGILVRPLDWPERPRDPFLVLLDRMRSQFNLDDPDEAMRIAVEEQHAARQERRERTER
jgi:hypothetical protein